MSTLLSNLPVLSVAILLGALAWVFGGIRGNLLPSFVPCLALLVLETAWAFPQRHAGETMLEARSRVARAAKRDPFVHVALALLVVLALPFLSCGPRPFLPWLPFCVNRLEHLNTCLWFLSALAAGFAVRHALLNGGRRLLVELLVWNGVLLAVFGFAQMLAGAQLPFGQKLASGLKISFFSTFSYANMAGDYFTALFILSLALWHRRREAHPRSERNVYRENTVGLAGHRAFWSRHYPLVASLVLYAAALATYSRFAILLSSVAALFVFGQICVYALAHKSRVERVKSAALILLSVAVLFLLAIVCLPRSIVKEVATVTGRDALDRVSGRVDYHGPVAFKVWTDNPVFGCGGWGYRHVSGPYVPAAAKMTFRYDWGAGAANVHNDYLQFLCEHGAVGLLLFLAAVFLLARPGLSAWRVLVKRARFLPRHEQPPHPFALFAAPAAAQTVLLAIGATLVHACGDCPLRSPAVLALLFAELAALDGFLPHLNHQKKG